LVGRPNAGKSTLFNRLSGKRSAIVNSTPGTTRDWREEEGTLGSLTFTLLDTAGLEDSAERASGGGAVRGSGASTAEARARQRHPSLAFEDRMLAHTERAVRAADVAVFLVDGRKGITEGDREFAAWLRRTRGNSPCVLCVNKTEGYFDRGEANDSWAVLEGEAVRLGLGPPVPVSAEHGEGLVELHDALLPVALDSSSDSTGQARGRLEAELEGQALVQARVSTIRQLSGLPADVGPLESKVRGLTMQGFARGDAAELEAIEARAAGVDMDSESMGRSSDAEAAGEDENDGSYQEWVPVEKYAGSGDDHEAE